EARIAEMHVSVDHAGQHVATRRVQFITRLECIEVADGHEAPVGHSDVGLPHPLRGDQRAVPHDQVNAWGHAAYASTPIRLSQAIQVSTWAVLLTTRSARTPRLADMQELSLTTTTVDCCIVGGGPGGAVLALLLARQGVRVVLLEAHQDFARDFR